MDVTARPERLIPTRRFCLRVMVSALHAHNSKDQITRELERGWDELGWDLANSTVADHRWNPWLRCYEVAVTMREYPWSEGPGDGTLVGFFRGKRLDLLVSHYDSILGPIYVRDYKEY